MKPLNWYLMLGLTVAVISSIGPTGLSQEEPHTTSTITPKQSVQKEESSPEFVKVTKEGKKLQSMQTAVVTYSDPNKPNSPKVTLIGAVHIAEPEYYSRLNTLFKDFDALLFEMVMNPSEGIPDPKERGVSPVSTIQVGMKDALGLTFQLDEIDYKAKNFVHADMTPEEFFKSMRQRKEGLMQMVFRSIGASIAMQARGKSSDMSILMATVGDDPQKGLRRALAEQMVEMDGQMAALSGDDGKSTLITERNAKAFEVLDQQIRAGKKNLGIFYGAGHLKDMHQRLTEQYGMKPEKIEYLDAWNLK